MRLYKKRLITYFRVFTGLVVDSNFQNITYPGLSLKKFVYKNCFFSHNQRLKNKLHTRIV